jgi:hypothetical protein
MRVCRGTTSFNPLPVLMTVVLVGCAATHASSKGKNALNSGVAVIDCEVTHDLPASKKHGSLTSIANAIGKIEHPEELYGGRPDAVFVTPAGDRHGVKGKLTKGLAVFEALSPGTYYLLRVDEGLVSEDDADSRIYTSSKYEAGNIYQFEHKAESGWMEATEARAKPPTFEVAAGKATYLGVTIRGVCRRYIVNGEVTDYDPRRGLHLNIDPREVVWTADVDSGSVREEKALEALHKHYHKEPWNRPIEDRLRSLKPEASHDSARSRARGEEDR